MSDPQWDNVALLLHCDGANGATTFVDETGKTVTRTGNAVISTAQSKFGGASAYFDGSGDWLSVANNSSFVFGTGDFTIECFVRVEPQGRVVALIDYFYHPYGGWQLSLDAAGQPIFYENNPNVNLLASGLSVSDGVWHHIAVSRQGTSLRLFIDGNLASSTTNTKNHVDSGANLGIGAQITTRNPAYDLQGYIDEVRITKGFARYTSAFTPPTSAFQGGPTSIDPQWDNVSLLMHMDGANGSTTFVDEKGKVVAASGGAAISTAQSKFGGASAYLDGSGDWITVPYSVDFDFGSGDVTVECWLRPTAIPSVAADIATTNGASNGWGLRLGADLRPSFIWNIGGTSSSAAAASSISLNAWSHIAGVRAGSNTYIFINGQLSGTTPCGTGGQNVTNAPLTIGRNNTNASWYYTGYIDELRITKGVARYTSAFTPPNVPFPDLNAPALIDAIASGQLTPSPLSNLLFANWPLVGAEASGTLTPTGFLTVNNPQIIDGLLSGAMLPSGSMLVSSSWLIEAVTSGRLSPSEAAHILIDNLDPGAMQFAQIVGELELYSEVIRAAQLAGKIDLFGTMSVTPEHEAQVAGVLQLIDGEASFCGCGNG